MGVHVVSGILMQCMHVPLYVHIHCSISPLCSITCYLHSRLSTVFPVHCHGCKG